MPDPFASPLAIIQANISRALPAMLAKAGAIVVEHSDEAFIQQGWTDAALEPWTPRKHHLVLTNAERKDAGRAILVKTGRLRGSIRVTGITADAVTIGTNVPYAKVHNEGFTGTVSVAGHTRLQRIRVQPVGRQRNFRYKKQEQSVGKHSKQMRIIKRQFLGKSLQQDIKIRSMIRLEIGRCFKVK